MTETPARTDNERNGSATAPIADLLSGILDDAQTLIKQQAAMLRSEIREDLRRTGDVAKYMSIGAVLGVLGSLFLLISLVFLLHDQVPTLPLWSCWAIMGAIYLIGGAIAMFVGRRILSTFSPLPDKTLHSIEENLTWKTTNPRN